MIPRTTFARTVRGATESGRAAVASLVALLGVGLVASPVALLGVVAMTQIEIDVAYSQELSTVVEDGLASDATPAATASDAEQFGVAGTANGALEVERVELSIATPSVTDEEWGELHLRRALFYLSRQDLLGAATEAERCPLDPSAYSGADRAAFVRAWCYERMGADASLTRLADEVTQWRDPSAFADWVRDADARRRARVGEDTTGIASAEFREVWERLGSASSEATDSYSTLAAILGEIESVEMPEDASSNVGGGASVSDTSMPRDLATSALADWIADHPEHPLVPQAHLRLGSVALDRGEFERAADQFARARDAVDLRRRSLLQLKERPIPEQVWGDWERDAGFGPVRVLEVPPVPFRADAEAWTPDLVLGSRRGAVELPARSLGEATGPASLSRLVPLASPDSLAWVSSLESAARSAFSERERARWRLQQARGEIDRRRLYLERGRRAAADEAIELRLLAEKIHALEADLSRLLAKIDDVSEREIARIDAEMAEIEARAVDTLARMAALDHFYETGPDEQRQVAPPQGYVDRGDLLGKSERFAGDLSETAAQFREVMPDRIRRSREQVWKPAFIDGISNLSARIDALLRRSQETEAAIARKLEGLDQDALMARFHDEVRAWDRVVSDRVGEWTEARRIVVGGAVDRELARLEGMDEPVRYTNALAAYELAIRGRGDVDTARSEWAGFLEAYPKASTRAEALYRLADLELTGSKERFREEMAAYLALAEGERVRHVVPILESGRALELYGEIVRRHPDFAHLDAALYHVGVLKADDGDDSGMDALEQLVAQFPNSAFRQEADLRMADYRFDQGHLDLAATLYESAADGADPGLSVIALYKLGWSHYRSDRFDQAASSFARVLDLYESGAEAPVSTDLRGESTDYLIHSLARGGGGANAADLFDTIGPRSYERDVFAAVGTLLRRYSLFAEAAECDRLWLDRYPTDPRALGIADGLIETYEAGERPELARAARLELAERFLPGTEWFGANDSDSLRTNATDFSRTSIHDVALFHHHRAREMEAGGKAVATEEWERALALYDRMLALWRDDPEAARIQYQVGEVAARSGKRERAHEAFQIAARAEDQPFARDAAWQSLAVLDAWYEEEQTDVLARALLDEADAYLDRDPFDLRGPDLAWRQAGVAWNREWDDEAASRYEAFARRYPQDARSPKALALRGDVFYRSERYDSAANAYVDAERAARSAGQDSLAHHVGDLVPHSFYLHAESLSGTESAQAFERLAFGWPRFEQAENSLYRAGVMYAEEKEILGAARCFEELLHRYPDGEYVRDAHLQLASTLEDAGRDEDAARAFERFSVAFPADDESGPALLHSADLWREAGNEPAAEATERSYVERFPEDRATAAAVYHRQSVRDLDRLGTIDAFSNGVRPGGIEDLLGTESDLANYIALAEADSSLADPALLARVDFLRAEEVKREYETIRLLQPLAESLARKKTALEATVGAYGAVVRRGVSPYSQAAAFRIGEALIGFGDRLRDSERPSDLSGDDLVAYDEVLEEQSWSFYDRGEDAWAELLRNIDPDLEDDGRWLERTQSSLWPRVADRFVHLAEVDHPIVAAIRPKEESR
ncbi:MAG: tetratricopeptide repeat protein [Candidatus Eisenbacteria bacterium]|uniref:Tetratricopeptide repeat protein n=1 Tax=Eiseniibacteriota bacterium TaxID=2212470 RepID=A0A956SDJ9_UNCEI|nr:tetratricopeptide repeat protein [Candidatus Eisenbacteria bacterium]